MHRFARCGERRTHGLALAYRRELKRFVECRRARRQNEVVHVESAYRVRPPTDFDTSPFEYEARMVVLRFGNVGDPLNESEPADKVVETEMSDELVHACYGFASPLGQLSQQFCPFVLRDGGRVRTACLTPLFCQCTHAFASKRFRWTDRLASQRSTNSTLSHNPYSKTSPYPSLVNHQKCSTPRLAAT